MNSPSKKDKKNYYPHGIECSKSLTEEIKKHVDKQYYGFNKSRKEKVETIQLEASKISKKEIPNKLKNDLNSEIWDENGKLKNEIKQQIKKIAKEYIEKIDLKAPVKDIVLTGSMANYNWTDKSDLDLHIIIDFSKIDDNKEFVRDYFDLQKSIWGLKHDIRIKDHDVEIYVQDENQPHHSTGVYSIKDDEWKIKPEKQDINVDVEDVRKKAQNISDLIDGLDSIEDEEKRHVAADKIKDKVKKLRQTGLEREGEYSSENLAFKALRNSGYLDKLSDIKIDAFDKAMSLDETFKEDFNINEKAQSEKQQQFFGIVRALQTGEMPMSKASKKARKAAKEMSKKDVLDYASTDHDEIGEDISPGGLADNMEPNDIAKKHSVELDHILSQLEKGIKVEFEHTNNKELSTEIALDHLFEDPDYYTKLAKIEPHHKSLQEEEGEESDEDYEYGCLMSFFDVPSWEEKILSKIDKEDLYDEPGYGLEYEPHATILYGFHPDEVDYEDIIEKVKENVSEPLKIEVKGVSCFENDEFDVVKLDLKCEKLEELNSIMKKNFPHTNNFPVYHPHATIAYVKSGEGKKYQSLFEPRKVFFESSEFVYSGPGNKKIRWSIDPEIPADRVISYKLENGENNIVFHKGEGMFPEKMELIRDFVEFVCRKLDMKEPVTIHYRNGRDNYIKTTASYVPAENSNHINYKGRALVDVYRSTAHELTHNRQRELGKFKIGEYVQNIGGELENEADSTAGMLIKDFTHNNGYDEIYDM